MTAAEEVGPLAAAGRGFHVFPLKHRTKDGHMVASWATWATTDVATIAAEFTGRTLNYGIACGPSRLLVLDEDQLGELERWATDHGHTIPATFTVSTGKGRHWYYRAPDGVTIGNKAAAFDGYAVDVRGPGGPNGTGKVHHGGYVLGPGSVHPSGAVYSADNDLDPAPAPGWLVELLTETTRIEEFAPVGRFELPERILSSAVHGAKPDRDTVVYRYACSLEARGVPLIEALTSMEHVCYPRIEQPPEHPYPLAKALEKVHRVYAEFGDLYTGGRQPLAVFDVSGEATDETERDSWEPVDLGPYLDGTAKRPEPSCGIKRSDGLHLLYSGLEHVIIGETESGKSWFACQCCHEELTNGHVAVYVHFEEGDPTDTIERLIALGVSKAVLRERFVFVGPAERVTRDRLAPLLDRRPSLVVFDGVNEAMALHGLEINSADGAATFRQMLVRPFMKAGAAVLSCDHVVKDHEKRGRDAYGSIHKGNALSGARFMLENHEPFGRGLRGRSSVFVTKDRPGYLRRHGRPDTHTAGKTYLAELVVDDVGIEYFGLNLKLWAPSNDDVATPEQVRRSRADLDDAEAVAVIREIAADGKLTTENNIAAKCGMGRPRLKLALARLEMGGRAGWVFGPNRAHLWSVFEDQQPSE
jgi:hypothetical protein